MAHQVRERRALHCHESAKGVCVKYCWLVWISCQIGSCERECLLEEEDSSVYRK